MPELAYVNGVFGPIHEAKISIEDRGFQFGDGIYEVIFAYGGKLFLLEEHLQRLQRSLTDIGLQFDFEANRLENVLLEGVKKCELRDVMIYIQITRGVAPRVHAIPDNLTPTVIVTFKPLPVIPDKVREKGIKLMTTRDNRWANCYIKAITLLPNILAKTEALRRGCGEALFVTESGEVRECTSANIFVIQDGAVKTPPRNESVLHGITQRILFECATTVGCTMTEEVIPFEALHGAEEIFVSSTAVEVLGVVAIDDKTIGDGKVGPWTRRLYEEFRRRARA